MPRVHTKTRSTRVTKHPYRCTGCGEEIVAGERYYEWEKRYGGPQRRHHKCGYPRPTQLSNRKTAQIEEAIQDMDTSSIEASVPEDWDGDVSAIEIGHIISDAQSLVEEVASVARDVASEYESGADNMPENLQYSPTAEAMREVASELESWADDLESLDVADEPDWPERDEETSDADWRDEVEGVLDAWVEEVRAAVDDKTGDMPDYQG